MPRSRAAGLGGTGTGRHAAWLQHRESFSLTHCYGRRKGRFNSFLPDQIRRDTASPTVVKGRGGLCATSGRHRAREPSGEKGPGGDVLRMQRRFTGFRSPEPPHTSLTLWGHRSPCCPGGARRPLRAFQKRESGSHQGPAEVLGQQEPPVAAGSALPASGVQPGGQGLSFKSSVCLSPRKAPRGTD